MSDDNPEAESKRGWFSRLVRRKDIDEAIEKAEAEMFGAAGTAAPAEQPAEEPLPPDAPVVVVPEFDLPEIVSEVLLLPEDGEEARPQLSAEPPEPQDAAPAEAAPRRNWLGRLKEGLSRSSSSIGQSITGLFTRRKLDDEVLDELEEVLIRADLGVAVAGEVRKALAKGRFGKEISYQEVRQVLAEEVARVLEPCQKPLTIVPAHRPHVVLMVGVNGTGKTTTIGKLAARYKAEGLKVMLAAGDTFRAAAIEQLAVWGERSGVPVVTRPLNSDAAGLAFDALQRAKAEGIDVLLIDTAGRLQNKEGLMAELSKIDRVLKKLDPAAPHDTVLVLDATTGQNALSQVEVFGQVAKISGLVMTKLDGTARGGVLVALARKFGTPIHAVGVGEGIDDLQDFDARAFAQALAGTA